MKRAIEAIDKTKNSIDILRGKKVDVTETISRLPRRKKQPSLYKRIVKDWTNFILLGLVLVSVSASSFYFGFIASPNYTEQTPSYLQSQPSAYATDPRSNDTVETEITKTMDGFSQLAFGENISASQNIRIEFTGWNVTSTAQIGSYECRLNEGPYQTCTSPLTYFDQQPSEYTFEVRGVDKEGNVDNTPAAFMWVVK